VSTLTPGADDQEPSTQDQEMSRNPGNRRLSSRVSVRIAYLTLIVTFLTPIVVALIEKL
jgi:hypothetical protein